MVPAPLTVRCCLRSSRGPALPLDWYEGGGRWMRIRRKRGCRRRRPHHVALGFASSAGAADPVPNPAVSGPIEGGVHGYPWNHSLFALRGPGYDYTEQEFFFSGMATDLSTGLQAPYESRMLVRLPRNPADFSGIVTVEWLNVTAQMDLETSWPVEAQYLMGQGIGYVGVSAQL